MKLIVNEQQFPVNFATNQVNFTGNDTILSTLNITIDSESQQVFDTLVEIFKDPATIVINEDETETREFATYDLTFQKDSGETVAILQDYIPDFLSLNYSEEESKIYLSFNKEV